MKEKLTEEEREIFERYLTQIRGYEDEHYQLGYILYQIKMKHLYRELCASFSKFCATYTNLGRSQAYNAVNAYEISEKLSSALDGASVFVPSLDRSITNDDIPYAVDTLIKLNGLDGESILQVFKHALEISNGGPITAAIMGEARESIVPRKAREQAPYFRKLKATQAKITKQSEDTICKEIEERMDEIIIAVSVLCRSGKMPHKYRRYLTDALMDISWFADDDSTVEIMLASILKKENDGFQYRKYLSANKSA